MSGLGLLIFGESRGSSGIRLRVGGLSLLDRGIRTMVRAGVGRLTIIGIFGHAAGVILAQRQLTAPTRQVEAVEVAVGSSVDAFAAHRAEDVR